MKKIINLKAVILALVSALLLFFSILLVGCNEETGGRINFIVDGKVYESIETNGFEKIELPDEPTKDGFDFVSWYYDDSFEYVFTDTDFIKQELTVEFSLYAKFIPSVARVINYELDGGTNSPNNVEILSSGKELLLSDPTAPNEYLMFGGWYSDSEFEEQITSISKGYESQIDLYAKWVVKDEYGFYNIRSGSMEPALESGKTVIITDDYQELQVGDIIVFSTSNSSSYICHRIIEINEVDGQKRYITKGDSNLTADSRYVLDEDIQGKVIAVIDTPASYASDGLSGSITFHGTPGLGIQVIDAYASVTAQVQNSKTNIEPFSETYDTIGYSSGAYNLPMGFNDNNEPIVLTITITNNDLSRDLTVSMSSRLQEQINVALAMTQNNSAYNGEELTLSPQESLTITVTFTSEVSSSIVDIDGISIQLTLIGE